MYTILMLMVMNYMKSSMWKIIYKGEVVDEFIDKFDALYCKAEYEIAYKDNVKMIKV